MTDDTYFLSDAYNRWADELRPVGHGPRLGDIPVPPELHAHISRLVKRYYEYSRVDDPARKGRMITMNTVAARMLAARHSRGPFRIAPQSRGVIIYSDFGYDRMPLGPLRNILAIGAFAIEWQHSDLTCADISEITRMLLLTHGGYRPDWRGTVSDVIYFTETQARAWEELSTQEEIWRSADLRIGHRCESCGNEWLTNPRHTKAVSKQRRGRTLFGLGAAALGGGFGGALSGLVGGQIHACPRCQGTKSRDRLLAFCARCTTLCTDQILRTCTKCNTPFGADIKSGTQWETKPSSWV